MSGPEQEPGGRSHSVPPEPDGKSAIGEALPLDEEWDDAPYVCPGCHAVGEEPCAPDCIDAEIERAREEAELDEDYADDPDGFTADEQRAIVEGFEAEEEPRGRLGGLSMVSRAIADALDRLECYLVLHPPGSQSRDTGDALLAEARAALSSPRAVLLQEIADRADRIRADAEEPMTARFALLEMGGNGNGLAGGITPVRPDRQRERALEGAAWALLALEKLSEGGR